jgi:hypothetical protein
VWGGKAIAAAFEIWFLPLENKLQKTRFQEAVVTLHPVTAPHANVWVSSIKDLAGEISARFFLYIGSIMYIQVDCDILALH